MLLAEAVAKGSCLSLMLYPKGEEARGRTCSQVLLAMTGLELGWILKPSDDAARGRTCSHVLLAEAVLKGWADRFTTNSVPSSRCVTRNTRPKLPLPTTIVCLNCALQSRRLLRQQLWNGR